jgi:hypothetical protein
VFALGEEHPLAQVIIGEDVGADRAKIVQQHYPTLHLKENAALKDVLWDMEILFPTGSKLTQ